jgi:hypothetical protein
MGLHTLCDVLVGSKHLDRSACIQSLRKVGWTQGSFGLCQEAGVDTPDLDNSGLDVHRTEYVSTCADGSCPYALSNAAR